MPYFQYEKDAQMYYEVIGSGNPIILIHGFTNFSLAWAAQVTDLLYTGHQVILVDLPGHGLSTPVTEKTTVDKMAALIVALMDHLSIEKAAVCGLSLGGMIVQKLLSLYHLRVNAAIIANSTSSFIFAQSIVELWKSIFLQENGPVKRLEHTWTNLFNESFIQTNYSKAIYESWKLVLSKIPGSSFAFIADGMLEFEIIQPITCEVPTLIISGSADCLFSSEHAEGIQSVIQHASSTTLKGAGHISNIDSSYEFNQVLLKFLSTL